MSMTRHRLLDNTYKKTTEGHPIVAKSVARMYPGLKLYGWSTQDGTPSPDNPVPIASAGDSGEINVEVSGGNLADISQMTNYAGSSYLQISDTGFSFTYSEQEENTRLNRIPCKLKKGKQYICTAERSSNYITIYLPETEQYFGFGTAFTPNEDINYIGVYVDFGKPYDTYTVEHFMVNVGDTALPWEPYKTPQTLTLSTPNGLPGIPVDSGGNYTDESGQQWVCDEVDFKRGKYVQRIKKVVVDNFFDGADYKSTNTIGITKYYPGLLNISDCIISTVASAVKTGSQENTCRVYSGDTIFLFVNKDEFPDLNTANEFFMENPVEFLVGLATPIETELPAEEIAAYKTLHTYSPTTTVSNDAGAWMKVGYKTKKSLEVTT